jgi:hypothetical protein|tara:strand:+ start:1841 stop:1960 length:120 start_codon:yes stop_codon:yes gene_type:complete
MKYIIGVAIGIGITYFYPEMANNIIEIVKEVYNVIISKF